MSQAFARACAKVRVVVRLPVGRADGSREAKKYHSTMIAMATCAPRKEINHGFRIQRIIHLPPLMSLKRIYMRKTKDIIISHHTGVKTSYSTYLWSVLTGFRLYQIGQKKSYLM